MSGGGLHLSRRPQTLRGAVSARLTASAHPAAPRRFRPPRETGRKALRTVLRRRADPPLHCSQSASVAAASPDLPAPRPVRSILDLLTSSLRLFDNPS